VFFYFSTLKGLGLWIRGLRRVSQGLGVAVGNRKLGLGFGGKGLGLSDQVFLQFTFEGFGFRLRV
jgi:hypothetical protein